MKVINTIFASIALVLSLNNYVLAQQYQHEGENCYSQFTELPAKIEYDMCTPEGLYVSQENGNLAYTKYMYMAMDMAAENGDWDSAMINFKKAYSLAQSEGERQEAERGYKGAALAKYIQNHPESANGANAYTGWVYVTGVRSAAD